MKNLIFIVLVAVLLYSCAQDQEIFNTNSRPQRADQSEISAFKTKSVSNRAVGGSIVNVTLSGGNYVAAFGPGLNFGSSLPHPYPVNCSDNGKDVDIQSLSVSPPSYGQSVSVNGSYFTIFNYNAATTSGDESDILEYLEDFAEFASDVDDEEYGSAAFELGMLLSELPDFSGINTSHFSTVARGHLIEYCSSPTGMAVTDDMTPATPSSNCQVEHWSSSTNAYNMLIYSSSCPVSWPGSSTNIEIYNAAGTVRYVITSAIPTIYYSKNAGGDVTISGASGSNVTVTLYGVGTVTFNAVTYVI